MIVNSYERSARSLIKCRNRKAVERKANTKKSGPAFIADCYDFNIYQAWHESKLVPVGAGLGAEGSLIKCKNYASDCAAEPFVDCNYCDIDNGM